MRIEDLEGRPLRIAAAVETEPFAFAQSSTEDLTLFEVLAQALGAASACWIDEETGDRTTGSLIFDSTRAKAIYERLHGEVARFQRIALEDAATRAVEFLRKEVSLGEDEYLAALRSAVEGKS